MTDVIVVDEQGRSVIGKAPTTPRDESVGYMESLEEALKYMKMDLKRDGRQFCGAIETAIYTGTSMLNALINLNGLKNFAPTKNLQLRSSGTHRRVWRLKMCSTKNNPVLPRLAKMRLPLSRIQRCGVASTKNWTWSFSLFRVMHRQMEAICMIRWLRLRRNMEIFAASS